MKILIIGLTPPLEGGSQQHIFEVVKRLDKKGVDVTVLTQKGTLCNKYVRCIEIPLKNKSGYAQSFEFYNQVKKMIGSFKGYDVIHLHESYLFLLIPALKRTTKAKVIATVHGLKGFKYYDCKLLWWIFKNKLNRADKLIAVSPAELADLKKEIRVPIEYISNGVDISIYKKVSPKISKKITFIGRIHEQKGLIYLLEAFEKIKNKFPDLKLEIVGRINDYALELKKRYLDKRIIWKGYISDRQIMAKELKSAHCIVLPSLWEAGPPLTLFESWAAGRPVIISSLKYMQPIVNSKNSFLVRPKDSNELAKAIAKVILDKRLASKIAKEGHKSVKFYDWKNIALQTKKVYLDL